MWICMRSLSQLLKTIVFCLSFGFGFSSSACAWWVRTLFTGIQDDPCNSTSVGLAHIFSDHLLVGESHLEAQFVPLCSSSFAPAALHSPAWVPNKLHNCASFNTSSFFHICVCVCVCVYVAILQRKILMDCLFMNCCQKKKHTWERINNELRDGMGIRSPQFALQFSSFPPQHPQQQLRYHQGLLLPLYHEPLLLRLLKSLWKMLLLP